MNCPSCSNTPLTMAERQGVEIDYCPKCRGVWLDRGELDKLLDRAASPQVGRGSVDFADSDRHGNRAGHYGRKKSWLTEIFD